MAKLLQGLDSRFLEKLRIGLAEQWDELGEAGGNFRSYQIIPLSLQR
ncbi:MAG: hypothetical protein V7L01_14395 [Nostoc sp.]